MPLVEDDLDVVHSLDDELLRRRTGISAELEDELHERPFYPITGEGRARLRSPKEAVDLNGFYELVGRVVEFKLQQDGWDKPLVFTQEFPEKDDDLVGEVITYGLTERLPGIVDQTSNPHLRNARRQRKPVFREVTKDRANPGYAVIQEGLVHDNFVTFTCWARENKTADIRALWFEDLMRENEWVWRAHGVIWTRYEGRSKDIQDMVLQRKVVGRPMTWMVRTERMLTSYEKTIEDLAIRLHLIDRVADRRDRVADT